MPRLNLDIDTLWTAIIGGEAIKGPTFVVADPASETRIARVTQCNEDHVARAVETAHHAYGKWAALPAGEREAVLLRFAEGYLMKSGFAGGILENIKAFGAGDTQAAHDHG